MLIYCLMNPFGHDPYKLRFFRTHSPFLLEFGGAKVTIKFKVWGVQMVQSVNLESCLQSKPLESLDMLELLEPFV
jgi:hypothetical protein